MGLPSKFESRFASSAPKQPCLEPEPHKGLYKNRIFSLCLGHLYSEDWDLNLGLGLGNRKSITVLSSPSHTLSPSPHLCEQNFPFSSSHLPQALPGQQWPLAQLAWVL